MNRPNNPYKLAGLRAILALAPEAAPIQHQLDALELAVEQESAQAFDMADGLVGSICKTILAERQKPCPNGVTINFFKEAITWLPLAPDGHPDPTQVRNDLEETLRGLTSTVQGLYNLRRNHGVIAHGRDAISVNLQAFHIDLAARAADAIGCFLLSMHRDYGREQKKNETRYEDFPAFNDSTDDKFPLSVWNVPIRASEALYKCDLVGYEDALLAFDENAVEADEDDEDTA